MSATFSGLVRRARRGGAALETAFILPPMLTMLVGVMEIGWYYHHQYAVTTAAALGARAGAAEGTAANVSSVAATAVSSALDAYGVTGETTNTTLTTGTPSVVTVTVAVPFSSIAGLVPMPLSIVSVSTAMYEDVKN